MGALEDKTLLEGTLPAELHTGTQTTRAHCNGADSSMEMGLCCPLTDL